MERESGWAMVVRLAVTMMLCAAVLWMASCGRSDRQIRNQAQEATERAKAEAEKAAADARVAAANATREANDVAQGVRAGLHNGHGATLVNVNSASRTELEGLPGVTAGTASRIEADRPYGSAHDLVRKGAVSEGEYDRIAGDVTAH